MKNRKRIAVAALLLLAATGCRGLGQSADDLARSADDIARGADDVARSADDLVTPKPASLPEPAIAHPAPAPEPTEIPPAVTRWTEDLSAEDAADVIGAACDLTDLSKHIVGDLDFEQARQYFGYRYGDDQLTALLGLVKEMRGNAGVEAVCKVVG